MSATCGMAALAGPSPAADQSLRLTEAGKPRASIVVSAKPAQAAMFAAIELRDHVKKISGADLPILSDTAEVKGMRILVGASAATRALGLKPERFKEQEYMIGVRKGDLVLMGRDADTPYGVRINGRPQWGEGRFGKAIVLGGERDSLVVTEPIGFDDAQGSMELWFRPDAETNSVLLRLDGDPWSYHIVSVEGGRVVYTTYDGKAGSAVKSGALTPGWHHVLVTWDAAKNRKELFVDGRSAEAGAYGTTHCAKAPLQIGAMDFAGGKGAWFKGALDEFRLYARARTPDGWDRAPSDADAIAAMACDEGTGAPHLTARSFNKPVLTRAGIPPQCDAQATAYAVYHFLERNCGVRWYGPTEINTVIPKQPTLIVKVADVRRRPSFAWRWMMPEYNFGAPMPPLWEKPTQDEMWLFAARLRNGGEKVPGGGHTYYPYYDRFWRQNPNNKAAWEEQHLEWFAHGYEGQPPQMCYNSEGFIAQVIKDAKDAFEGRRAGGVFGDWLPAGGMDNTSFCKCPMCLLKADTPFHRAELKNKHFSNGRDSDYWFDYCNRLQRELRKTCPGKGVRALAYASWTKHPSFPLDRDISVVLALAGNIFIDDPTGVIGSDLMKIYREWAGKRNPLYLYLYAEFPESPVWSAGYTCFPGFGSRLIARQMQRYHKDGVRGLMLEGITTMLNECMFNQMAFDAAQDPEQILSEFFTLYYGAAAEPMRKLWLEIEAAYTDPANWPAERTKDDPDPDVSITEERSWKLMGTAERMARWAGYMEEAEAAARTDTEKARVQLFAKAQWEPMVAAKRLYDNKSQYQSEVEALKKSPPPSARIPRLAEPANGDLDKVDWNRGENLKLLRDIYGYPAPDRHADVTILHDGQHLYLRLQERTDTKKLRSEPNIFFADDWEIFWAAQRDKPYRQVGVNPQGAFQAIPYGEGPAWDSGIKVVSDIVPDLWTTRLCLPLANVLPDGLRSGQTLYFNAIRASFGAGSALAHSPHFDKAFHVPARLAELKVE
ncbi:MAG: DUF4838 domain-containing protein [Kiritimatiellae bacterium]|nr:DUF4838 domain-containing protein [Kiritimatiellia bacterium]